MMCFIYLFIFKKKKLIFQNRVFKLSYFPHSCFTKLPILLFNYMQFCRYFFSFYFLQMWCNKINCKHIMYYIVVDFYYFFFAIYNKHPLVMYIMYIKPPSETPVVLVLHPFIFWICIFCFLFCG